MKEFLEDLEALLVKHVGNVIASDFRDGTIVIYNSEAKPSGAGLSVNTAGDTLTLADIQRFKRELEARHER
jgi:hypothetical protein